MFGLTLVSQKRLENLVVENADLKTEKQKAAEDAASFKSSWEHRGRMIEELQKKLDKCINRPRGEKGRFSKKAN